MGGFLLIALTPFVPLSRRAGEGERAAPLSHAVGEGLGVRGEKRARPANSEPERCALTPCVPLSRRAGEGERAAPLSHAVGEGLGVRAKKRVCSPRSEPKCCTLISCVLLSRRAGEGERAAPLSHCVGEGLGVRAKKQGRRGASGRTAGSCLPEMADFRGNHTGLPLHSGVSAVATTQGYPYTTASS